jgi:single stranded DNA-binding protein
MGIRKAFLQGNLTREPEMVIVGEWRVIKFSIACNEGVKQADGTFKDRPHFFDCEYWTKKPDYWLQQLKKGAGVTVEAEPVQQRWSSEDGQTQHSRVMFKLSAPPVPSSRATNAINSPATESEYQASAPEMGSSGPSLEGDIPF